MLSSIELKTAIKYVAEDRGADSFIAQLVQGDLVSVTHYKYSYNIV